MLPLLILGKISGQPCFSTFTFGCAFGVMHVAVTSIKQGIVMLRRDLSGVLYKEITAAFTPKSLGKESEESKHTGPGS